MYSFDPSDHGLPCGAALSELASTDAAAPDDAAVSPYYRTTVQERDSILAHRIRAVAEEARGRDIVAVVGANHLPGILQHWFSQRGIGDAVDCERFLSVPPADQGVDMGALWKLQTVEGLATCMEVGAACTAVFVPCALRLQGPWRFAPLAVAGAGVCASSVWSGERQRRIAQLVHNLAVHQDCAGRLQTAA
jgi:hypothetical protein